MNPADVLRKMAELAELEVSFATITVVGAKGSSPRGVGAKMVVLEDGTRVGTIGGDCLESQAVDAALRLMADRNSSSNMGAKAEAPVALLSVYLEEEERGGVGMLCGGRVDLLIEVFRPRLKVVVAGSGPVATSVARLADFLEIPCTLLDPVPPRAPLPRSVRFVNKLHEEGMAELPINEDTAIVIVTRHKNDVPALRAALSTKAGYVGMIGSRHRVQTIFNRLSQEMGVGQDAFRSRVHAPIGLDLGAITPQEIALSILAEVLMWFRRGSSASRALYAEASTKGRAGQTDR